MKIVIAGGSGHLGNILFRYFQTKKYDVLVLTRSKDVSLPYITWDGKTLGKWQDQIDGSDVVINLAGRSVNCRYHDKNLKEMMNSRVDSTYILGQAISKSKKPPKLWLQMSTATIYAHSFDKDNDEYTGIIGGNESNVPSYWSYSIKIAKAWEKALIKFETPLTRKVIMRTAMVMSISQKGVFNVLLSLTRMGLGGPVGGGRQYVSWMHVDDFIRAIEFFIAREDIKGVVNLSSPNPISQVKFMSLLRSAWGTKVGLPAAQWMAEIGAFFLRTDTELILKSRRVVPTKLIKLDFKFKFPNWEDAVKDLTTRFMNQKLKQRSIVIYDDDCAFCKTSQQLLKQLDWLNNFNCRPLQSSTLYREFPFLCPEKCRKEMKLISKSQKVYSGGDAVIKICSGLPLMAAIGWICHLPPLRWLVHWIYLKIAKNRYQISRFFT